MITSKDLDNVLKRFQNRNYDKTKNEITLKCKDICQKSKEFNEYIDIIATYAISGNLSITDLISREFLAGLIVGVILEKEYKL